MILLNKGLILVTGLSVLSVGLGQALGPALPWPAKYVGMEDWSIMLGCFLGFYGILRAGHYLNRDVDPDFRTTFLGLPLQYWGGAGLVFSLAWFGVVAGINLRGGPPGEAPPARVTQPAAITSGPVKKPTAPVQSYKVTAVFKSGGEPQRWLFEITDDHGERHSVRVGESVDAWTVAEATQERLILLDQDHARRITLAFPKDP